MMTAAPLPAIMEPIRNIIVSLNVYGLNGEPTPSGREVFKYYGFVAKPNNY